VAGTPCEDSGSGSAVGTDYVLVAGSGTAVGIGSKLATVQNMGSVAKGEAGREPQVD
jgi:hypothetical protein